jgi:predicted metal-dependent enzyme (double-stranded beta helix superfamily)
MAYSLDAFCQDIRAALKADPGPGGREAVRQKLEQLLADRDFVAAHVLSAPPGRHTLYEDPEFGFCVLAHINARGNKSPPHDHGASWAVYGQASEYTDMTEWQRLDGGSGPGPARIEAARRYRLEPGHAGTYDIGAIHNIEFPDGARFVRVTGVDLERIPRLKFDLKTGLAEVIESASAGAA